MAKVQSPAFGDMFRADWCHLFDIRSFVSQMIDLLTEIPYDSHRPAQTHGPNQRTEAKVGCNVLNRMTGLGMPVSARIR
jgi:hypothetical protein